MSLVYLAYTESSDWYDPDDVYEVPANYKEVIKELIAAGMAKVNDNYYRKAKWIVAYEPWACHDPRKSWLKWNSYPKDHVRDPWAEIYM